MNERQKEVLQTHRKFLTRNLIFTDDLLSRLVAQGIITESLLKDLQASSGRDVKAGKLLDALPLRGAAVFEKFCDTLHISGQQFLAEFLRDEETAPETVDIKDLYKKASFLEKALRDHEKKQLEAYITEKAKYFVLKTVWGTAFREKEHAMDAKQKQLEQAFEFEEKMTKKVTEIAQLEKKLSEAKNNNIELNSQIKYLKNKLKETEDKFKADFGVQMKFSMANENVIQKTNDKLDRSDNVLRQIENKLQEFLVVPSRTSERDQMALHDFPFTFLVNDFEKFTEKHRILIEIKKEYENLLDERNYILAQLGFSPDSGDTPSLLTAYREFAIRTDNDITELRKKVEKYSETIEGQNKRIDVLNKESDGKRKFHAAGNVWQGAIMSVMRKQLQDVKHENRTKETKMKHFETEISRLRARITELETIIHRSKQSHHHHHDHDHKEKKPEVKEAVPTVNGQSTSSGIAEDESESSLTKGDANKGKKNPLPPLPVRNPLQLMDPLATYNSSRRPRPRPTGSLARASADAKGSGAHVEGLVTSPVKLENRVGGLQVGKMSHGLGDLKAMHGKHVRQVHPTVKGAQV